MSTPRPCKACGKQLIFVIGPSGKLIPLDVGSRNHIYEIVDSDETGRAAYSVSRQEIYVSHYLTCPKASTFSKGGAVKQGDLL